MTDTMLLLKAPIADPAPRKASAPSAPSTAKAPKISPHRRFPLWVVGVALGLGIAATAVYLPQVYVQDTDDAYVQADTITVAPKVAGYVSVLHVTDNSSCHLLIGLSLVFGLFVRASGPFAILLLVLYWTAHMDFPYIENMNNFLIDYHLVYAAVVVELMRRQAGHVFGLDAWAATLRAHKSSTILHWLVGEGAIQAGVAAAE